MILKFGIDFYPNIQNIKNIKNKKKKKIFDE